MTPLQLLEKVYQEINKTDCRYAVCGGLAASYYRSRPRLTNDADLLFKDRSLEQTKKTAEKIINKIGYKVVVGWISSQRRDFPSKVALIIGQMPGQELSSTIDFLLPVFPWFENALERAKDNLLNYGFAKLPTITIEDIIVAKLFSLAIEPSRFSDLDDLKSIFLANHNLDLAYLSGQCESLALIVPREISSFAPKALKRFK
ncbi:nucleotidyl transferase AbiEii/AbiGii toxin family protein [bacterium]|nr:nucleotidyl transferase AbiEii/AbiGii toxin family protein [bacterium]